MKQTAVDFIIEKLAENGVLHSSDIWMAKSIEKVHIVDAFSWNIYGEDNRKDGEQYYNEIFNKKV